MILPILQRANSVCSSQQCQNRIIYEKQDYKSSLYCSTTNQSTKLNKSTASLKNSRLYSSTVTTYPNTISQEILIQRKHLCKEHEKKLTYTCITCNENVCALCLSNPLKHRSHRFHRYSEKKEDLKQICAGFSQQIKFKRDQIYKDIAKLQNYQQNSQNNQTQKIQNLNCYNKRLTQQYAKIVEKIEKDCKQYKKQLEQYNSFYQQTLKQIKNSSEVSIVLKNSEEIDNKIKQKTINIPSMQSANLKKNFNNLIKPNLYTNMFIVSNFTQIKQTTKEKIFQPFQAFYSLWKLKVYPSGYSGAKMEEKHLGKQYTSIYLERIDGLLQSSKFHIQIQITSRRDPRLKIKKQFNSQFAKNQSWGYDRYTRLSNLYEHGFLGDDDTLFIKFSISPANFYQGNRALNQIIKQKQQIQQQNERKKKILKIMLQRKKNSESTNQDFFESQKRQFIIQSLQTIQSVTKLEPIKQETRKQIQNKNQTESEAQVHELVNTSQLNLRLSPYNSRMSKYHISSRIKQQREDQKQKRNQRTGTLNIERKRTTIHNCPSISLQKKSPGKLIRLVSLKNTELIENSRKKIHNRSSTFY